MSTLQKVRGDGSRGPDPPLLNFACIEKRTEAKIENRQPINSGPPDL